MVGCFGIVGCGFWACIVFPSPGSVRDGMGVDLRVRIASFSSLPNREKRVPGTIRSYPASEITARVWWGLAGEMTSLLGITPASHLSTVQLNPIQHGRNADTGSEAHKASPTTFTLNCQFTPPIPCCCNPHHYAPSEVFDPTTATASISNANDTTFISTTE